MSSTRQPRGAVNAFLREAKQALRAAIKNDMPITLVMGTSSANLDSIASSILFAYLRSQSPPSTAWSPIYIPLQQTDRQTLATRSEFTEVFAQAGIQLDDIITLEDLLREGTTQSGLTVQQTRMFLVNSNIMEGRMGQDYRCVKHTPCGMSTTNVSVPSNNILGCIDNHQDTGYVPHQTTEPRVLVRSGACTSLVVNWGAQIWDALAASSGNNAEWDRQLATLALWNIMVDTNELQAPETNEEDIRAVRYLESKGAVYGQQQQQHQPRSIPAPVPVAAPAPVVAAPSTGTYTTNFVDLPTILSRGYTPVSTPSGGSAAICTVPMSINAMVEQSERDLAHAAEIEAMTGTSAGTPATGEIVRGSPFTRAVRLFAQHKGADVIAIVTRAASEPELFLWNVSERNPAVVGNFLNGYARALQLDHWEGEQHEIVKEAGASNGMMKVYCVRAEGATEREIGGMLERAMS